MNHSRTKASIFTLIFIALTVLCLVGAIVIFTAPEPAAAAEAAPTTVSTTEPAAAAEAAPTTVSRSAPFTPTKFTTFYVNNDTYKGVYNIKGFDTNDSSWKNMTAEQKSNIAIVIPATYNDGVNGEAPVAMIGILAFKVESGGKYDSCTFTSLDLSGAIYLEDIQGSAFNGCSGLTGELKFPKSLKKISGAAFYGCSGLTGELKIPDTVTRIGDQAFDGCSGLTGSLTIPDSVSYIGSYAFRNCSGFDGTLTLPTNSGFTSIEYYAFSGCNRLTGSLEIPDTVTSIGSWAFDGCSGLTGELKIPDTVTEIGYRAFQNCSGLNGTLTLPTNSGFTSIEYYAFYNCSGLTGPLTIPDSVTIIKEYAFYNCSGLTGPLTIPDSVTIIKEYAFYNCSGFDGTLTLPTNDAFTTIDNWVFYNCSGLTGTLTIPNSVTSIGGYAFYNCSGFDGTLTLPTNGAFRTIKDFAFYNCSGLIGGLTIPNSVTGIWTYAFDGCSKLTGALTIPDSVSYIGPYAFRNCSGFDGTLTLPTNDAFTTIDKGLFYNCSGLTGALTIPNFVTEIKDDAFNGCSKIETVYLPWASCGERVFDYINSPIVARTKSDYNGYKQQGHNLAGYSTLTYELDVVFNANGGALADGGDSVTQTKLFNKSIKMEKGADGVWAENPNYQLPTVSKADHYFVEWNNNVDGSGTINPETLLTDPINADTPLAYYAQLELIFSSTYSAEGYTITGFAQGYIDSLTAEQKSNIAIDIPAEINDGTNGDKPVVAIGSSAFSLSPNMEKYAGCKFVALDLLGAINLERIETSAFSHNAELSGTLEFPNNGKLKIIEDVAFADCGFTGSLVIPDTVEEIGGSAFENGLGFHGTLTLPNNNKFTIMNQRTFSKCNFIGTLTIPDSVSIIGSNAFAQCINFNELRLGNGLTEIAYSAFIECTGFKGKLTIPKSVVSIGGSFGECTGFTELVFEAGSSLETIGEETFGDCTGLTGVVRIPDSVTTIGAVVFGGCASITAVYLPNNNNTVYSVIKGMGGHQFSILSDPDNLIFEAPTYPIIAPSKAHFEAYKKVTHALSFYPTLTYETTVTFDGNGGAVNSQASVSETKLYGYALNYEKDANTLVWAANTEYSLPTAWKSEHFFNGFNTAQDGNGDAVTGDTVVTDAPTYYADYEILKFKTTYVESLDGFSIDGFTDAYLQSLSAEERQSIALVIPATVFNDQNVERAVVRIGYRAFAKQSSDNYGIASLDLSKATNLKEIEDQTFVSRSEIGGGLTISDSVIFIGEKAFSECWGFNGKLKLPDNEGFTDISAEAFAGCGFTGVLTIPDSVTHIGAGAFQCRNLQTVYLPQSAIGMTYGAGVFDNVNCPIIAPDEVLYIEWTKPGQGLSDYSNVTFEMTATFNGNGGTLASGGDSVTQNKLYNYAFKMEKGADGLWAANGNYQLPTAVRTSYDFTGWNGKADGSGDPLNQQSVLKTNYYAQFAEILSSIEIAAQPNKTEYKAFDTFDDAGMIVKAHYKSGNSATVASYEIRYNSGTSFLAGDTFITVAYAERGVEKTIDVAVAVAKIKLAKPTVSGNYTYNGGEQTVVLDGFEEEYMNVANTVSTLAGTYDVTITIEDTDNYEWSDGTVAPYNLKWTIEKLKIDEPTQDLTEFVYTGQEQAYAVADSEYYTVDGNKRTDAGKYTVTVSLNDKANTEWASGGADDIQFAFAIAKADYDMSGVTFESVTVKEDGQAHKIEVAGLPDGVSAAYTGSNGYSADGAAAVGVYEVTAEFSVADADNFNVPQAMRATLTINQAKLVIATGEGESKTDAVVVESEKGIAPGVRLSVEDVTQTEHGVSIEEKDREVKQVYDVSLLKDGAPIQPDGQIKVRLLIAEGLRGEENLKVYGFDADGRLVDVNAVREGDYMVFSVSNVSKLAIVGYAKDVVSGGAIAATAVFWSFALLCGAYILYYYLKKKKFGGNNGAIGGDNSSDAGKKSVKTYSVAPLLLAAVVVPGGLSAAMAIGIIAFVAGAGFICYLHYKDGTLQKLLNKCGLKRAEKIDEKDAAPDAEIASAPSASDNSTE